MWAVITSSFSQDCKGSDFKCSASFIPVAVLRAAQPKPPFSNRLFCQNSALTDVISSVDQLFSYWRWSPTFLRILESCGPSFQEMPDTWKGEKACKHQGKRVLKKSLFFFWRANYLIWLVCRLQEGGGGRLVWRFFEGHCVCGLGRCPGCMFLRQRTFPALAA